jgi:hypothetical protein
LFRGTTEKKQAEQAEGHKKATKFNVPSFITAMSSFSTPTQVLDYWFGETRDTLDLNVIKQRMGLWFGRASPDFDAVQLRKLILFDSTIVCISFPHRYFHDYLT